MKVLIKSWQEDKFNEINKITKIEEISENFNPKSLDEIIPCDNSNEINKNEKRKLDNKN